MYTIEAYSNTNFGSNDLVWNVPHPAYNFLQHPRNIFHNVEIRQPKFTEMISVQQEWDDSLAYIDYLIIYSGTAKVACYFVQAVVPERGNVIFSVLLDVITSYEVLATPISGVLVRKHDTNLSENRFDYPTALNIQGNYNIETYEFVNFAAGVTRLIESAVNLTELGAAVTIASPTGSVTVPTLGRPAHTTLYQVTTWGGALLPDENRAFTLYLNDTINPAILNTIRGLSGDGAISDSYAIPTEAVTIANTGAEVTTLTGRFLERVLTLRLEIDFSKEQKPGEPLFVPMNEAIRGAFAVRIASTQEKNHLTFQAWDVRNSIDVNGFIMVNLWSDCKPSGAPFCCPTQVETLFPANNVTLNRLATLEVKSVRGGQWLRNPLIYTTGRGEIFATVETRLQRERADFEKRTSLHQLEMSRRAREIEVSQADFNYQSGQLTNILGGAGALVGGDVGGVINAVRGTAMSAANRKFVGEMRSLQQYEQAMERQLIKMAHSNNLKNLNVQETMRRIVAREVVFQSNESLGSYTGYNGFTVSIVQPDLQTLRAKDIEYSKYGYPVYESVQNFNMLNHLRVNHSVFQFERPIVPIGGIIGNMIREALQGGIRVCRNIITPANLLNNPKV